ncbi:MAG TPA: heparan-alpha-glucosaminide N-acetyltransferase domain-containing protein [Vicinamibacterales bacterium]|nr:heparan-alpha-glucosaminide N-acetyltransferase domain-containing protein [Vicinamibacterales bacterium]
MTHGASDSPAGGVHAHRVIFIDLARALAAVFMMYGHTVSALLAPGYQKGAWFEIWVFQRGLTSSLFLLLSGFAFSIATGRHWSSHGHLSPAVLKRARRFSLFILLGYALHFPVSRFAELPTATAEQWRSFLAVDVLQLIGVTFIGVQGLLLAARSRRAFGWSAFALGLATILLTPVMWSVDWTGVLPLWMAAYLAPSTGSQFPLFPFSAYVLVGAALGQLYARWGAARLTRFAIVALLIPGVAMVALALVMRALPSFLVGSGAWDWVPTQVTLRMGASLIVLAVIARASQYIGGLPHYFGAVAQETLLIYFIHLCIVYGSVWNRGLVQMFGPTLRPGETFLFVVLLIAGMTSLAWYWNWWKHVRPRAARWISMGIGALLLYRLL